MKQRTKILMDVLLDLNQLLPKVKITKETLNNLSKINKNISKRLTKREKMLNSKSYKKKSLLCIQALMKNQKELQRLSQLIEKIRPLMRDYMNSTKSFNKKNSKNYKRLMNNLELKQNIMFQCKREINPWIRHYMRMQSVEDVIMPE